MEKKYVEKLIELALKAERKNESPIAALIVCKDTIIAKAYNKRNKSKLTTSHAEIEAINKANKKLKSWRLNKCTMYVTVEPCEMCEKVIKEARIQKVYYLLEREDYKKQYNKTEFIKYDEDDILEYQKKYISIIKNFWKNKR